MHAVAAASLIRAAYEAPRRASWAVPWHNASTDGAAYSGAYRYMASAP